MSRRAKPAPAEAEPPAVDRTYLSAAALAEHLRVAADHYRQCRAILIRQADALPVDTPDRVKQGLLGMSRVHQEAAAEADHLAGVIAAASSVVASVVKAEVQP
jgi:hypothetical protein